MPSKELHERPSQRDAPLREEDQPPALLQELRHPLHGIGRVGVDRKGQPVHHDKPVQPAGLGGNARGNEFPVLIQANAQKRASPAMKRDWGLTRPVQACLTHRVKSAKRVEQPQQEPEKGSHNDLEDEFSKF